MTIRGRSRLRLLVSMGLIVCIGLTLIVSSELVGQAIEQSRIANTIVRGVFELNLLTSDYLRHRVERAREQWGVKHAALSRLLTNQPFQKSQERILVNTIRESHDDLRRIFDQLIQIHSARSSGAEYAIALEQRLIAQLLQTSQAMVSGAVRLGDQSQADVLRLAWRASALVIVLAAATAAVIVMISWTVSRSVLRPLKRLQEGTAIIGTGNLDHKIQLDTEDEIGELSRAFDVMTDRLKVVTVSRDELAQEVASRKHAEAALARHAHELEQIEERLRLTLDASPNGMLLVDKEGKIVLANAEIEQIFQYKRDELLGEPIELLLPDRFKGNHSGFREAFFKAPVARRMGAGRDLYSRRQDGSEVPVEIGLNPMTTDEGTFVLASVVDITRRKHAEEQLRTMNETLERQVAQRTAAARANEERVRLLLDSTAEAIYGTDTEGNCTFANRACARLLGCTDVKELLGQNMHRLIHHPCPDGSSYPVADGFSYEPYRRNEDTHVDDEVLWRTDGTSFPAEYWSYPIHRDGEVIGSVVTFLDITERKRAEEALAHRAQELERSNAELQQFAYVASHDLQEPLRMVGSYTQLLAKRYRGKLDRNADEFIDYAIDGANRMQLLINDLLAYSRVGTRSKPFAPIDLQMVFDQALSNLGVAIAEAGATVTHTLLPTVMGDKTQLVQLFQNLIGNAIKFKGEAAPNIHISAEQQLREWEIAVHDNGIGIEPAYAERIFEIFQRLHHRDEYAGTGIGLAICKKIVEHHGGRIWVASEAGQGSTFRFTIPVTPW